MDATDKLVASWIVLVFCILLYTLVPWVFVSDEATYLLMVKSFVLDGQFHIWNGLEEVRSIELMLPGTHLVSNGVEFRLYGVPAPLYVFLAAPFYLFFGFFGLNLMNVISFCAIIWVLYLLACMVTSKRVAAVTVFFYCLTYTLAYSQMLWPHMLSVLLVLSSLYLMLRAYLVGGGVSSLFLSGILSGVAVGVRYPNGLFTLIQLGFIFFFMRSSLKPYLSGLLIPATVLAYMNYSFYGSVFETSYPTTAVNYLIYVIAALLVLCCAALTLSRKIVLSPKSVVVLASLALLALSFFEPTRELMLKFIGQVFDMRYMPGYIGAYKRGLLQSVPYLVLSVFAYPVLSKKIGGKATSLVFVFAFSQILISPFTSAGGWDETYGMRYLLDSVPYLVLLSFIAASDILQSFTGRDFLLLIVVSLLFCIFLLSSINHLFAYSGVYHHLPALLYFGLFVATAIKKPFIRWFFPLLLVLCVSYSVCVAFGDYWVLHLYRGGVSATSQNIADSVSNNSVIVYAKYSDYPLFAPAKTKKLVRLVMPSNDGGADLDGIIRHYNDIGVPVYISNDYNEMWYNTTVDFVVSNNLSNVYFMNYQAHAKKLF